MERCAQIAAERYAAVLLNTCSAMAAVFAKPCLGVHFEDARSNELHADTTSAPVAEPRTHMGDDMYLGFTPADDASFQGEDVMWAKYGARIAYPSDFASNGRGPTPWNHATSEAERLVRFLERRRHQRSEAIGHPGYSTSCASWKSRSRPGTATSATSTSAGVTSHESTPSRPPRRIMPGEILDVPPEENDTGDPQEDTSRAARLPTRPSSAPTHSTTHRKRHGSSISATPRRATQAAQVAARPSGGRTAGQGASARRQSRHPSKNSKQSTSEGSHSPEPRSERNNVSQGSRESRKSYLIAAAMLNETTARKSPWLSEAAAYSKRRPLAARLKKKREMDLKARAEEEETVVETSVTRRTIFADVSEEEEEELKGRFLHRRRSSSLHLFSLAREVCLSTEEVMFMKTQIFDRCDENGKGWLDVSEFEEAVHMLIEKQRLAPQTRISMESAEMRTLVDKLCRNVSIYQTRTGTIDFDHFMKWFAQAGFSEDFLLHETERQMREIAKKMKIGLVDLEGIKREFDACDTEKNGAVDTSEFKTLLVKLWRVPEGLIDELPKSRIDFFWHSIDTDNSGTIDFIEFLTFYLKYFGVGKNGSSTNPYERFYSDVRSLGRLNARLENSGLDSECPQL